MSSREGAQLGMSQPDGLCAYQYFQVQTNGHAVVVLLYGAHQYRSLYAGELEQELGHLADFLDGKRVIVDFGRVPYCCTAMIGGLLRLRNRLRDAGGEMVLCSMTPECRQAFSMLNLDGTVFAIYESLDEALERFCPPQGAVGDASSP